MKNKLAVFLLSIFVLTAISCTGKDGGQTTNSQTKTSSNVSEVGGAQTPTEAYTMLYAAVKSKQTDAIKKMMTQKTLSFAESVAAQQKKPIEAVYENGFTATTFAATMPQTRDERVKDNMGALEVWSEKDKKWEDLPFIKENGGWKLAIGDIFGDTYKKPAKGQAEIEEQATNKLVPYNGDANLPYPSNEVAPPPVRKPLQKPLPQAPPQNSNPQ